MLVNECLTVRRHVNQHGYSPLVFDETCTCTFLPFPARYVADASREDSAVEVEILRMRFQDLFDKYNSDK